MDAVSNASSALMSLGREPISGGQMLEEVIERKFDRQVDNDPPAQVHVEEPKKNDDVEYLKHQLAALERQNTEMRSTLDRTTGSFQSFLQQQQQQQYRQPDPLPSFETEDPLLAAAMNTLDQRVDRKLQALQQQQQQQELQRIRMSEAQRFDQALNDLSDLTKFYSRDQLQQFAAPYINDPRYAGLDWKKELTQVLKVAKHDVYEAENADLRKKLEAAEKRKDSERQQQKQNLKLVPGIGQRSGGAPAGKSLGEQILSEYKGSGRSNKPTYKQFGQELIKRLTAQ